MNTTRSLFKNQDYNKLKHECLKNKELFYDECFQHKVEGAMWLRPKHIAKNPKFFIEGASTFDAIQGKGSDCWLIVAMANLTLNPNMFNHVVPKDQDFTDDYAGIFRFNIWQCGKWVEVVVDDRLPTRQGQSGPPELMYAHSKEKGEYWSALLEKAYAKLYGTYHDLDAGWFYEAMVDLTGGISERVQLNPVPENLESVIKKSLNKSSFMCVFMPDEGGQKEEILNNGLVQGHGYSVTKAVTVSVGGKDIFLLRLRNPWGKIEWNGGWSDSSQEWGSISQEDKRKMGLVKEDDGEFWMSFTDFTNNFVTIEICHTAPDLLINPYGKEKVGWEAHVFRGEWTIGVTSGGASWDTYHLNPQYIMTLTDTDDDSDKLCTVLVSLMQKNKTRHVWHSIGFTAYLLQGPEKHSKSPLNTEYLRDNFHNSKSSDYRRRREIVVRDLWEPGVYCIIPSTSYAGDEGQFLLRVYSEKKVNMEESQHNVIETNEIAQDIKELEIPQGKRVLKKNDEDILGYFKKIAGDESEIGWDGLQSILEYALTNARTSELIPVGFFERIIAWLLSLFAVGSENKIFSKAECRSMIALLDIDDSGSLSLEEFQILLKELRRWELVFLQSSDETDSMKGIDLSKALIEVGFRPKSSEISRLVRKYCDKDGKLRFDDFVMCCIESSNGTSYGDYYL